MLKQIIPPLLFFLSGFVAMGSAFLIYVMAARLRIEFVNPFLVLLAAAILGVAFFFIVYRLIFMRALDRSAKIYAVPIDQAAGAVRDLLSRPIPGLKFSAGWEETRESRHAVPDRDGTITLSFESFYDDVNSPILIPVKRPHNPEACLLRQDVLLEANGDGTRVEITFDIRTGHGDKASIIERKTRDFIRSSLS